MARGLQAQLAVEGDRAGSRLVGEQPVELAHAEAAHTEYLGARINDLVARDPGAFRAAAELAFGTKAAHGTIGTLIDAAATGRLPVPPVRFVDPGALGPGALGAYLAPGGAGGPGGGDAGLILLDRSLLADPTRLESTFVEEWGHHLDALLGGPDAAGDEGAIFARGLLAPEGRPSGSTLARLAAETDHARLWLDGRVVTVERSMGIDSAEEFGPGTGSAGTGGGSNASGDTSEDNVGDAGHTDTGGAGTTGGDGPGPVTEAPVETTGGFDPSLDGLIPGGAPGAPGGEREEFVTVDGGAGGGGTSDDTTEDNVGDGRAGEPDGTGGGEVAGGSTIPGLGTVPIPVGSGSVIPPGLAESLDPFARTGLADVPTLGPVHDPPPDNVDGNPFDEVLPDPTADRPDVSAPLAPPRDSPSGDPAENADRPWWSDVGHVLLDVIGLVPVVGEWADGLNASWYAAEGRYFEASLSAAGTVPFVGIGATVAKWFGTTRTVARAEELAGGAALGPETLETIDRLNRYGFTDIAEAAGPALSRIGQVNVETRARISAVLDDPDIRLRPDTRRQLETTARALDQHLSDADLSGALQERTGIPIGNFSHGTEIDSTLSSLRRTRRDLINRLNHGDPNAPLDSHTASELSATIDSINLLSATVRALLD